MKKIFLFIVWVTYSLSCTKLTKPTLNKDVWVAFEDTTKDFMYRYGYKDLKGNIQIEPQYTGVETDTFNKDIAFVTDKKTGSFRWIVINRKNEELLSPFIYDMSHDEYHDGLFRFVENGRVGEGGKMGFADSTGKIVIPAKFTFVDWFEDGLAGFCYDCKKEELGEHWRMVGKWGFVNTKGEEVISPQFDKIESFGNRKIRVLKNGLRFYINRAGEPIINLNDLQALNF